MGTPSRDVFTAEANSGMSAPVDNGHSNKTNAWLAGICLIAALAYAPGLYGPFLFDDINNLEPLSGWLSGSTSGTQVALSNDSGLFGRPLSLLSFMLNALIFGTDPFYYKCVNVCIHLICGILIFKLCRDLIARDPNLHRQASSWSLAISAIWLLHPLQASTVLYVVQRMAQLSALFVLVALLCYVRGRNILCACKNNDRPDSTQNSQVPTRNAISPSLKGSLLLFVAFPLATLAASLSKENGVLAPLFALIIELAFFPKDASDRRLNAFFAMFLLVPGCFVAAWYIAHPDLILAGYEQREFTLVQRLLTEPRVLLDYVGALLLPRGSSMGVYGDDFPLSKGWFDPATTLPAIFIWIVAAACSWRWRRQYPTIFAGVFLFLAGHLMESSVFSLEIYFEHRNYLPSVGVFLVLIGLIGAAKSKLSHAVPPRFAVLIACALSFALAFATHMRAWSWQSWAVLVTQAVASHPESMRAQLDFAALYITNNQPEQAYRIFGALQTSPSQAARNVAAINLVTLDCKIHHAASAEHRAAMEAIAGRTIGGYEITAVKRLVGELDASRCDGLPEQKFAGWLSQMATFAPQRASGYPIWTLHHIAADFYARAGEIQLARSEAEAGWSASRNVQIGLLLAHLQTMVGSYELAEATLSELRPLVHHYDWQTLRTMDAVVAELRSARPSAPVDSGP